MTSTKDDGTVEAPHHLTYQAVHHLKGRPVLPRVVVIHCTDGPERPGTARALAQWVAGQFVYKGELQPPPVDVAHWYCDALEAYQVVDERDVCWHAGDRDTNDFAIGIEIVGLASQTREQWMDAASLPALTRAAIVCAQACDRWAIPKVRLSAVELRAGRAGICGHDTVTEAFPAPGGHHDPGQGFPWDVFMGIVCPPRL